MSDEKRGSEYGLEQRVVMHVVRDVGMTAVEEARTCGVGRRVLSGPRVFGNLVSGVARELEGKGGRIV